MFMKAARKQIAIFLLLKSFSFSPDTIMATCEKASSLYLLTCFAIGPMVSVYDSFVLVRPFFLEPHSRNVKTFRT